MLQLILHGHGYRVRTTTTYRDGLDIAMSVNPNLILLDNMVNDRHGIDMLADLRANPTLNDIPVVMMTVYGNMEVLLAAIAFGVNDFLHKPFHVAALIERVKKWVPSLQMAGNRSLPKPIEPPESLRSPSSF